MVLIFDGSGSGVISIPSTQQLQLTKFSLAVWFKTSFDYSDTTGAKREGMMVNKGGWLAGKPKNMSYGIWQSDANHVRMGFEEENNTDHIITTNQKWNDGKWHHAVGTYDKTILKLYMDGALNETLKTSATPEINTQPLAIGVNSFGETTDEFGVKSFLYYVGELTGIKVYNRAISASEITNIYNAGNGLVYFVD